MWSRVGTCYWRLYGEDAATWKYFQRKTCYTVKLPGGCEMVSLRSHSKPGPASWDTTQYSSHAQKLNSVVSTWPNQIRTFASLRVPHHQAASLWRYHPLSGGRGLPGFSDSSVRFVLLCFQVAELAVIPTHDDVLRRSRRKRRKGDKQNEEGWNTRLKRPLFREELGKLQGMPLQNCRLVFSLIFNYLHLCQG